MGLFESAREVAERVRAHSREIGVPVTVCVVDSSGHLVLEERMDGAGVLSLGMAERKAFTAAMLGMPTAELMPLVQPGGPLYGLTEVDGGQFVAFGGGVPLTKDGVVIAGVGVSGGSIEQDTLLATAGVEAPTAGAAADGDA